ncbi:hypothetical protein [Leifsonia naganoensis]|uniref:Uncharacterized protein n=1 Tax=Leifsonia naganoensis TaxID=150025 RepID=A0A853DTR5_9MICO|nr:hypothetical protein [Leifsonia naganoensis]NYK09470.1 hypothetical protein [Leifsonia naganoensis]
MTESILTKLVVDPSSPKAGHQRRIIHRLVVAATLVFVVGSIGLIVTMVVAVLSN